MHESDYTRKLRKELEHGGVFFKISDRFNAGIPDLLGCVCGRFAAIEVKVAPNGLTGLQQASLTRLAESGSATFVAKYNKILKQWHLLDWATGENYTTKTEKEASEWLLKQSSFNTRSTQ